MLAPIPIPETRPATELIDGRLVQKMSPKRHHQALEARWMNALNAWAAGTMVVFVVDPPHRTVVAHTRDGVLRFGPGETVSHPSMPGFAYETDPMFEGLYLGD
jgi:hypothetical protein